MAEVKTAKTLKDADVNSILISQPEPENKNSLITISLRNMV